MSTVMTIILHKLDASPPSRAAMMLIELLGINVKFKDINLPAREHLKPEYLEKNPLHTVPLLEDKDFYLSDSHAIMVYLVTKFGGENETELYPDNTEKRAIVDQQLYFDASVLFPRLQNATSRFFKNKQCGISTQKVKDVKEAYSFMEDYLRPSPYIAGNHITIADLSCVATISSLDCIVPVDEKYPKVNEWWNRLENEDWYQKCNISGLKSFDSFVKYFNQGRTPPIINA